MDVVQAVTFYINKLVSHPPQIKALLLDAHTTPILSLASTQSSLLAQHVYLTDRIDNRRRERMPHLQCVVFVRPTEESLEEVGRELEEPRYGGYYLYFSNTLTKSAIERLASRDTFELVHEVQEHFADYLPLLPHLFSLNHSPSTLLPLYALPASPPPPTHLTWSPPALQHHLSTLSSLLLSLKKRPHAIRYERTAPLSRSLGRALLSHIAAEPALFDFRASAGSCVLLILDRLEDPVTPLLMQWTYQAMVHELLGIHNARVDLSSSPSVRPELREITLTPQSDPFLAQHLHTPFGDLSISLQSHVAQFSAKHASASVLESVEDMKRFVEEYPEFRRLGGNVSKHVELVGEMSRLVARDAVFEVSEAEQEIAVGGNHAEDWRNVQRIVANPAIPPASKLRLAMLYALRYQSHPQSSLSALPALLSSNGVPPTDISLITTLLTLSGTQARQSDLFSNSSLLSRGKSVLKALKGAENVYTQHTPYLQQTLEGLVRGRLREQAYPFVEGGGPAAAAQRPQDVIVFFVGGTTYEESKVVAQMNAELAQQAASSGSGGVGTRILLGGSCVHNSKSFLELLRSAAPLASSLPTPSLLPTTTTSTSTTTHLSTPHPNSTSSPLPSKPSTPQPALNLQLGSLNLSVGGPAGTGVYRGPENQMGVGLQVGPGTTEAVREGVGRVGEGVRGLLGRVRGGLERVGSGIGGQAGGAGGGG